MEDYQTIGAEGTASIQVKKSEFIGLAAHAETEEQALAKLSEIRSAHPSARHTAFAYVLRQDSRTRHSDDGEPAKTAGLPILSAIQGAGLTDCIVGVTRYFGGVLLGTGGLVRAYGGAAKAALERAQITTVQCCISLDICLAYPQYDKASHLLEEFGAKVDPPLFTDKVALKATLPADLAQEVSTALKEATRGSCSVNCSEPFFKAL